MNKKRIKALRKLAIEQAGLVPRQLWQLNGGTGPVVNNPICTRAFYQRLKRNPEAAARRAKQLEGEIGDDWRLKLKLNK